MLAGFAWNLSGLGLPAAADEVLQTLGQAVVPVCLVLIGMSMAYYGMRGAARGAIVLSVVKLILLPGLVLLIARGAMGCRGCRSRSS